MRTILPNQACLRWCLEFRSHSLESFRTQLLVCFGRQEILLQHAVESRCLTRPSPNIQQPAASGTSKRSCVHVIRSTTARLRGRVPSSNKVTQPEELYLEVYLVQPRSAASNPRSHSPCAPRGCSCQPADPELQRSRSCHHRVVPSRHRFCTAYSVPDFGMLGKRHEKARCVRQKV